MDGTTRGIGQPEKAIIKKRHSMLCRVKKQSVRREPHLGPVVSDTIVAAHTAKHVAAVKLVPTIS
jgi:hypothetical protein